MPPSAPDISVVLPLRNEAGTLPVLIPEIRSALLSTGRSFEILCIDDGSSDATGALIDGEAAADSRVVPIHLSRNFGKEAALLAGLEVARGAAVVLMDADMQHPPALLAEMIRLRDQGADVVEAVRRSRGDEGLLYRGMARLFYALLGRSVGRGLQGSTDYKLLDRQVVDALLQCHERNRFFRGLVAWVGFRVAQVPFVAGDRAAGHSQWSLLALLRYSVRSLLAFTSLPLRIVAWTGLGMVLLGGLLAAQTLYNYVTGRAVSGFTTVILVELILGGLILTSLGVVAFYLALIYDEQKARPPFIIRRAEQRPAEPPAPQRP